MSGHKLLLADDSVTVQKVVQLTFAEEGIDVSICGDGDTAMVRYAEFQPDIVLADVNMPGLSGYQVCEKIKAEDPGTPVILLVGSFEPFDRDEADRVGADDSMTKPFQSIRQLIDVVQGLLRSGNGAAEADIAPAAEAPDAGMGYDTASWEASMADTREIPVYDDGVTLGDTGMDDEMIEATRPDYERDTIEILSPLVDTAPGYSDNADTVSDSTAAYEQEDHSQAETAPLVPPIDLSAGYARDEEAPAEDSESPFTLQRIMDDEEDEPSAPAPQDETSETLVAPVMELDDMNFLEIPVAGVPVLPPVEESIAASPEPEPASEFVDEVVERVLQRLSGDSLRDVVREVVREMRMEKTRD